MAYSFDDIPGLIVTRFCGPVRDDGGSRTLYQLTSLNHDQVLVLTTAQMFALRDLIAKHLHPAG